jgi:ParB-like chromosome segregation protein Spo0J
MKWLGVKSVRLKSLILPGDFPARLQAPHVAARAKSIAEVGVIALPVVEWPTKRLIAGNDRVAALSLNNADIIEVRAVEGTPAELRRVMLAENIERRPKERDELIREYVGLVEEQVKAEAEIVDNLSTKSTGRRLTPLGVAREQVAQALGVSKDAVRKAEERAAAPRHPRSPRRSCTRRGGCASTSPWPAPWRASLSRWTPLTRRCAGCSRRSAGPSRDARRSGS